MSNKPLTGKRASDGYALHDATDPRCKLHENAKRHKGIAPRADRQCPACTPTDPVHTPVHRKRRRATRAATVTERG